MSALDKAFLQWIIFLSQMNLGVMNLGPHAGNTLSGRNKISPAQIKSHCLFDEISDVQNILSDFLRVLL